MQKEQSSAPQQIGLQIALGLIAIAWIYIKFVRKEPHDRRLLMENQEEEKKEETKEGTGNN